MSQARGSRKRSREEDDESFDMEKAAKLPRRRSARNLNKPPLSFKDLDEKGLEAALGKEEKLSEPLEAVVAVSDNSESLEDIANLFLRLAEGSATPKKGSAPSLSSTFSPSLKVASKVQRTAAKKIPLELSAKPNVQIVPPHSAALLASPLSNSATLSSEDSPKSSNSHATPKTGTKRRLSQIEVPSQNPVIKVRKLEAGLSTRKPLNRAKHALLYVF